MSLDVLPRPFPFKAARVDGYWLVFIWLAFVLFFFFSLT